ncbi:3577_t:CDS:1, partial [Scutellospora calospora]
LRVSNTSMNVTPGFIGTTVPGKAPYNMPKYLPALLAYQMTAGNVSLFAANTSMQFNYIPSLSCYEQPTQDCDQDVGNLPLDDNVSQCLVLQNPTSQPVCFNLSLSFTKTVFSTNNFTSPDIPGGHNALKSIAVSDKQVYILVQALICTFMVLTFSNFLH